MLRRLKRSINAMLAYVRRALQTHGLMRAYHSRPPYQQNDYLGWIGRAALEVTKQKRLGQMLAELKKGNVYMKMAWRDKKLNRRGK
ncbi:MAG: YdeI/OmpD-associated family protein [Candidatus Margulisiibacteriota bacterium]